MDSPKRMVFSDEDRCTLFRLPHEAYSRYEFFRDRLKDFHPRLIRTIDSLPNGLRNDDDLSSLNKSIESVTSSDYLEILVMGPGNTKITLKQLVEDYTEDENDEGKQSFRLVETEGWNDIEAKMKPLIVIYTMGSLDISKYAVSERPQWLKNSFQCCNPIFFVRDRKNDKKDDIFAHLQYILPDDFKTYNMRKTVIFQSEQDTLSTAISEILEELCVKAFAHIETYIFSVTKVSNLRDIISITLDELFGDFRMSLQRTLEDKDLLEICLQKAKSDGEPVESYFGLCLADRVAILLTSKLSPIFKIPGPAIHSFLYASKLREDTKDILLNLRNLDVLLKSRRKDDQAKPKHDTNLQESPEERVKGLDGKSSQSQLKATQRENQQQIPNNDLFVSELEKLKKLITLRIRAIKSAQPTIQTLKRLHFELEGILKETSQHLCTESELSEERDSSCLPTIALRLQDPYERWRQALCKKLKGVHVTTGTVFGKFCVFIHDSKMKEPEEWIKQKIKKVLSKFPYEYEVKIISVPRYFANGHDVPNAQQNVLCVLKMGMYCRSQKMRGTIGLFLKERSEPNNLFFVTSAHLVPNLGQEVHACTGGSNWVNLGKARVVIPAHENLIDITAVEVLETMRPLCSPQIEDERSRIVRARVFDNREEYDRLLSKSVYKKGAQTGVTRGIISSLCAPNHLIVSPLPGSVSGFAEEGDSGAIVCFNTPNRETRLLSMIMGQDGGGPKTVMDSETSNISLPDAQEGARGGKGQSPDDQLIFTTLLCTGLEKLKAKNLHLEV